MAERKKFSLPEKKTSFRLSHLLLKFLEKKTIQKAIFSPLKSTRKLNSTANMEPIQCPVSWCRRR
jgi:hypothetical protein